VLEGRPGKQVTVKDPSGTVLDTIDVQKPLEQFQLTFERDGVSLDVIWESTIPTAMWPYAIRSTVDQSTRHIEHSGTVKGTLRIGETVHRIDCFGHRDHSFGGERNWSTFETWDYLSGEIDENFWFNALKIRLTGMPQPAHVGCLWDGQEVMALTRIEMPDDWKGHPQRKDYPLGGIPVEYRGATVPPPDERRSYE